MKSRDLLALVLCLGTSAVAWGFSLEPPIALGPYGGAMDYSRSAVLPLTPTSLLLPVEGPDGNYNTADDQILVITGLDGVPSVTPLAVPFQGYAIRAVRLSATRAVITAHGPDATSETADDQLFVLDRLGTANTVTPVTIGPVSDYDHSGITSFGPDLVGIAGVGPDATWSSADDVLILVSDVGGANTVTSVSSPYGLDYAATPVRIAPDLLLMAHSGPDMTDGTADDGVHVFTDVGGANTRTDVPAADLRYARAGLALRLSPTTAILASEGPDSATQSADDRFYLFSDLGGSNAVTPITVPNLIDWAAASPQKIDATTVVTTSAGPDQTTSTADDGIVILSDVGGTNAQTSVTVGFLEDSIGMSPLLISRTAAVIGGVGPDGVDDTADDVYRVIADLGTSNSVVTLPFPGTDEGMANRPTAISASEALVVSGGPDGALTVGLDALVSRIGGIGSAPFVQSLPFGSVDATWANAHRSYVLGHGRAAFVQAGFDDELGAGFDDELRILSNLETTRELVVEKLSIKSSSKGDKASVKATLELDDAPTGFGETDVTISIGNAGEMLAAADFTDKGKKVQYKAPKGSGGLISSVTYKPEKGTLKIKAGGNGTGLETTMADYVPVAIEFHALKDDELYVSDVVAGEVKGTKIKYKRPK